MAPPPRASSADPEDAVEPEGDDDFGVSIAIPDAAPEPGAGDERAVGGATDALFGDLVPSADSEDVGLDDRPADVEDPMSYASQFAYDDPEGVDTVDAAAGPAEDEFDLVRADSEGESWTTDHETGFASEPESAGYLDLVPPPMPMLGDGEAVGFEEPTGAVRGASDDALDPSLPPLPGLGAEPEDADTEHDTDLADEPLGDDELGIQLPSYPDDDAPLDREPE